MTVIAAAGLARGVLAYNDTFLNGCSGDGFSRFFRLHLVSILRWTGAL